MARLHIEDEDALMSSIADAIERFLDFHKQYIIPVGLTDEELGDAYRKVKRLIKRLRTGGKKGRNCLEVEYSNELLDSGRRDLLGGSDE